MCREGKETTSETHDGWTRTEDIMADSPRFQTIHSTQDLQSFRKCTVWKCRHRETTIEVSSTVRDQTLIDICADIPPPPRKPKMNMKIWIIKTKNRCRQMNQKDTSVRIHHGGWSLTFGGDGALTASAAPAVAVVVFTLLFPSLLGFLRFSVSLDTVPETDRITGRTHHGFRCRLPSMAPDSSSSSS